jgi:hypothetical protein
VAQRSASSPRIAAAAEDHEEALDVRARAGRRGSAWREEQRERQGEPEGIARVNRARAVRRRPQVIYPTTSLGARSVYVYSRTAFFTPR